MSYVQAPVLPLSNLSFSVEKLLQQQTSNKSAAGGSVGSDSDNESTPPSSPDPYCNYTDLRASVPHGGQFLVNASSLGTALPCIHIPTLAWNPRALGGCWPGTHTATIIPNTLLQRQLKPTSNKIKSSKDQLILNTHTTVAENNAAVLHESRPMNQATNPPPLNLQIHSPTTMNSGTSDMNDQAFDSSGSSAGNKKKRTTFSSYQLQNLEIRFNQQKYLTKHDRSKLAADLGLTEKHIKTWYQNRRTKWKRECSDEVWSKERENAATAMYAQHLQLKSTSISNDNASLTS